MPIVDLHKVGRNGINKDLPPHEMDPEWFTDARNVRFKDDVIQPFLGHMETKGTPVINPRWLLPVIAGSNYYWLLAGNNGVTTTHKFYCIDGTTHTDVTPGAGTVTAAEDYRWNGGVLNGVAFVNNGLINPLAWINPAPATALATFTNWVPGYLTTMLARVIRPYKNFLVALRLTEDGDVDDRVLRWSHPAAPGTLPDSWDDTNTAKDAGRVTLAETSDILVDCLPLGDTNIIYKERSIYGMSLIGGNDIFRFFKIVPDAGLIAQDCVCSFNSNKNHFIVSQDDLLVFNGQVTESIADKRIRRQFFQSINPTYLNRCWVANNYRNREIWFAYVTTDYTGGFPNRVLVWNYKDNTITFRDIGDPTAPDTAAFGTSGYVSTSAAVTWATDSETWDSDATAWDDAVDATNIHDLILAAGGTTKELWTVGQGYAFDDYTFTWYAERTHMAITGRDRAGNWVIEPHKRKLITEVWIQAGGAAFNVYVGKSQVTDGAITWDGPKTFTPETDEKVCFTSSGKYNHIKFEGTGFTTITGYSLNINLLHTYNG